MNILKLVSIICFTALTSCNKSNNTETSSKPKSVLSMKINGKDWIADNGISGYFHPSIYPEGIVVGGNIGSGASQQNFVFHIFKTTGLGTYTFSDQKPVAGEVQLAYLTADDYLYGGAALPYDFKVTITKASKSPAILEATFEGTLKGVRGDVIKITEGKIYHEE